MQEQLHYYKNQLFYLAYAMMIFNSTLIKNINNTLSKTLIITYIGLFILNTILKKYNIKEFIILHVGFIISAIIFIKSRETDILILCIVILSSSNIDFKKVVKIDFFLRLIGISITILLCTIGVTQDFIMYRIKDTINLVEIRHSLGFIHPNTLSVNVFILLFAYMFLRYKKIKPYEYIFIFLVMYVFGEITGSRTGVFCTALTIIMLNLNKHTKLFSKKPIKFILIYSVAICTTISLGLTILYNYNLPVINNLNTILTGRIKSASYFLETYGVSILGQQIKLVSIIQAQQTYEQLRILDNLYISLAVRSGILFLCIYNILYIRLNKFFDKNNCMDKVIFITIMTIYGTIEKVPINPELNFTVVLLGLVIFKAKSNNKSCTI
ncbi:hypothetical protein B2H97_07005 [Paraclostridium bifermentans]|uniref:hypothetical protein n=1 Tax=Paraclostridium bifermentans TaxID=1490 RepID=UPI000A177B86|nr:hypothetical protein [Paraclostridium bifermentans]OSB10696.1 hypothetical protein B2H97_07005 [Paraclostridium bifermentans]